jgi:uncharacterized protein
MSTRPPPEPIGASCPRPVARPVMLQTWSNLTSIHWPYDPDQVQSMLPSGLRIDVHDDVAWVGLIPFHMRRIRLPGHRPFGRWSTFPETNVRTYVVAPDGRRAVWFFSLDVSRFVPALVARTAYGLPYRWSSMRITREGGDTVRYVAQRHWPHRHAHSRLAVRISDQIAQPDLTDLEQFLTARWALASSFAGTGLWADVDHPPWSLHRAELLELDDTFVESTGLPEPSGRPVVLWSPGVEVRIGRPRRSAADPR